MQKKGVKTFSKKVTSLSIILNLLLATFAFSFIIYNASVVKGDETGYSIGKSYNVKTRTGTDLTNVKYTGQEIDASGQQYLNFEDSSGGVHRLGVSSSTGAEGIIADQSPIPLGEKISTNGGGPPSTLPTKAVAAEAVYPEVQVDSGFKDVGPAKWQWSADSELVQTTTVDANGVSTLRTATIEEYAQARGITNDAAYKELGVKNYKSETLGIDYGTGTSGYFWSNIMTGLQTSLLVYGIIQMLGGLLGLDKGLTDALSYGAVGGIMSAEIANTLLVGKDAVWANTMDTGLIGTTGIGIVVGLVIFALTYKTTSEEKITFQCKVWNPPRGGEDCEKCNLDQKNFPCTDYRCRSLGAGCELLNKGTGEEKCVWRNPRDVNSPTISPNYQNISEGYVYANVHIRPPGLGFEIKNTNLTRNEEGCVEAFYPIQFGITTDKPTTCKIDYNHTKSFDDMQYDFGESTTYKYNHTQTLRLPGPTNINTEAPELKNDGVYNLFVRCMDANGNKNTEGNVNEDEFAIKFCVNKGPDTTPAKIEKTSLLNNMPINFGKDTINITVYTNEPADCKWSKEDKDYGVMENTLACSRSITEINANQLYACSGKLTGIKDREENNFYFRCKDQPQAAEADRNVNGESYKFTITGTQPLNILRAGPNGTIMGSTSIVPVNIELETGNGYKDGEAICYYSTTGNDNDYVKFFETESYIHKQRQDLARGEYTYYFKCVDLGGNADYNRTRIRIDVDDTAPRVIRVKHDTGESSVCGAAGCLQITTNEESICVYSTTTCNFELANGIKMPYEMTKTHYAEWNTNYNYYIKCTDKAGNQPVPTGCSMTVKAYNKK